MKVVIGDRLEAFAHATGALTFTQFLLSRMGRHDSVVTGQGLSVEQVALLERYCRQHQIALLRAVEPAKRAGASVTHKATARNGLISSPVALSANVFEAELLMDEHSELMLDHLTGCHVQGMVLIEAIRQMFIAVSETCYPNAGVPKDGYVVLSSLNIRFNSFAFPLPASLRQTTSSLRTDKPGRAAFAATVEVFQNGACVTAADVTFTVFERQLIEPKEAGKARDALRTFTETAEPQLSHEPRSPSAPTRPALAVREESAR
jgi:hypothetical protein